MGEVSRMFILSGDISARDSHCKKLLVLVNISFVNNVVESLIIAFKYKGRRHLKYKVQSCMVQQC